jgi:hypothetical protein
MQSRNSELIQEIQGMGADSLLKENEDELSERLAKKYQQRASASTSGESDDSLCQSLAEAARENIVRRKANFFSGLDKQPKTSIGQKRAAS